MKLFLNTLLSGGKEGVGGVGRGTYKYFQSWFRLLFRRLT